MDDLDKDWNGKVGTYTEEEFLRMVLEYRGRWCRNNLAVYPPPLEARYFGNKRVVRENGMVRLEELR